MSHLAGFFPVLTVAMSLLHLVELANIFFRAGHLPTLQTLSTACGVIARLGKQLVLVHTNALVLPDQLSPLKT